MRNDSQNGFMLLALLLVIFVAGSSVMISVLNNGQSGYLNQQAELHYQMASAKEALLAYASQSAVLHANTRGPGFFPCPDLNVTDNDPQPAMNCDSNFPVVGRLPEYQNFGTTRFMFNDYLSGSDQQLWYVVAPRYVYHSTSNSLRRSHFRSAKTGYGAETLRMTLDGREGYVALIIAPGEALGSQDRVAAPNNFTNYLDGNNGSSGFAFFTSSAGQPSQFNDQIIGITLDEYMLRVGAVVAKEIKVQLQEYHDDHDSYPYWSSTFQDQFEDEDDLSWLKPGLLGNGERWADPPYDAIWTRDASDNDRGRVFFYGCDNMKWLLDADNDIVVPDFPLSGYPEC